MIRATLDVNVLASGFPAEQGAPAEILARWSALEFELVLSEHVLRGLERTWTKPYFQARYSAGEVQQTLSLLRTEAIIVVPVATVSGVAADEEDDLAWIIHDAGRAGRQPASAGLSGSARGLQPRAAGAAAIAETAR